MTTSDTALGAALPISRWTRLHILLHWTVVLLIAVQFVIGDWMSELFQARMNGDSLGAVATIVGPLHMAIGITVFLAIIARLWDHFAHGRPPHPAGQPTWAQRLAVVTQTLLYAIVFAMPIVGLIAWFGQSQWLASMHALAAKALFLLIVLHAAGALANHYWFRTDVLRRMLPDQGRDTDHRSSGDAAS